MKFSPVILLLLPLAAIADDTNALPALAPAYGELPPTFFEQHGTPISIGVFALLAMSALALWKILKPKPAVVLPPEIVARETLEKLKLQSETGKTLSEVSQALRRYVCAVFGFSTGEMTTAEFSATLADSKQVSLELAQTISNFLRECDERKFSITSAVQPLNAANRALELVKQIEKHRAELRARISAEK